MSPHRPVLLLLFLSILLLQSCNLLNPRNLGNENKWKNKKLETPLRVHYDFDPLVIRAYGEDSYFLEEHIDDSEGIGKLDSILQFKLKSRNFILSDGPEYSLLTVDSMFMEEYIEKVPVYDDEGDYLTEANFYDVQLFMHGKLNQNGQISELEAKYSFQSEPRPGLIISSITVHHNSALNMKKVLAILMNRFSYEAYKAAKANKIKSPESTQ